jgi:GMP synthase (glutamine-hydrolysing)
MRPILLVRNDAVDTFGLAVDALRQAGAPTRIWEAIDATAAAPDVDEIAGIVMFGGTMNVDEVDAHPFLKEGRDLTREAIDRGVPYLGLCLGAQMLARALDRPVIRAPVQEIGYEPIHPTVSAAADALVGHYDDGDMVFHWHRDTMELPDGADLLATGEGVLVQAFRARTTAWGLQFHLEIDSHELELWLDEASAVENVKAAWGKSPEEIRAEANRYQRTHERKGREVFRRFADVVGSRERAFAAR